MARKPAGKPGKTPNEKVQLSLPPATLKRLRIAAAELGQDLSEVVAELIDARFSGVHVRGMTSGVQAGQGSSGDILDQPANVAIPRSSQTPIVNRQTVVNRIGEISRSSGMPVDLAVESFGDWIRSRLRLLARVIDSVGGTCDDVLEDISTSEDDPADDAN